MTRIAKAKENALANPDIGSLDSVVFYLDDGTVAGDAAAVNVFLWD